jgi:hypothetical protein
MTRAHLRMLVGGAAVLLVGGGALVLRMAPASAAASVDALAARHAAFSFISSVHVRATAKLSLTDATGTREGVAEYEYLAQDNRYRIVCRTDPSLLLMDDYEAAFDGTTFYLFSPATGVLSVRTADSRHLPTALPNPFFLEFDYLSPESDDCRLCELRLPDVADKAKVTRRVKGASAISRSNAPPTLAFAGNPHKGVSGRVHLTVEPGSGQVVRSERLYANGLGTATQFGDFRPVAGAAIDMPHRMEIESYGDQPASGRARVTFLVNELSINGTFPPSVFQIDTEGASSIWDSDKGEFLKSKAPRALGACAKPPTAVRR